MKALKTSIVKANNASHQQWTGLLLFGLGKMEETTKEKEKEEEETMSQTTLQKAIEIVSKAAKCDAEENYQEAYTLYTKALDYFIVAMKCKKSNKNHHLHFAFTFTHHRREEPQVQGDDQGKDGRVP